MLAMTVSTSLQPARATSRRSTGSEGGTHLQQQQDRAQPSCCWQQRPQLQPGQQQRMRCSCAWHPGPGKTPHCCCSTSGVHVCSGCWQHRRMSMPLRSSMRLPSAAEIACAASDSGGGSVVISASNNRWQTGPCCAVQWVASVLA
jgi:hypothetical protein